MSTLNFQVNSIAYSDVKPSNNPSIRTFDLSFKLLGQSADRPMAENFSLAPGETKSVFSGTRVTAIDGTTAFTVTRPVPTENTYRFTSTAGTAPQFRTDRVPAVDNTSVFMVTVNGPLATYTNSSGTPIDTTNVVVGDILNIGPNSGFSAANRGRFSILAKTSTSLTIQNLNAVAETATIISPSDFLVYSNGGGSSNQTQIGDKVIISSGFSLSTQGTYVIAEVTPMWFEVAIAAENGLALESGIIPGASGLIFYSSSKKFILLAAQQKCSVRVNADASDNNVVEPVEANNPEKPGMFIKQGTCYSLSIKNLSLETLNLIVASVE